MASRPPVTVGEGQTDFGIDAPRSPLLRRIAAMVAPVAADAGAVVDNEQLLVVARSVCDAFSSEDAAGGLTRAEIAVRVDGIEPAVLDSRIALFVRMGLLRPIRDKKHQQRYVLAPSGLVGLLVFERIAERGGVEELLTMLDRTRAALERHELDRPAVAAALESHRSLLALLANEVARLVADAPLDELLAERRLHDHGGLVDQVSELNRHVTDQFPDLDPAAFRLVVEAQRYVSSVEDLLARVLDEGGETRNFRLLDPEDYLAAARTATVEELATVFADVVFDPASPFVDAGSIVDAVESYRPRRQIRERPPEPAGPASTEDPVERVQRQFAQAQERRALRAEQLLQGDELSDVTGALRAAGWPTAVQILADLLALDAEPEQPYAVELGNELIVDGAGPVTYAARVKLLADRAPRDREPTTQEPQAGPVQQEPIRA